TGAVLEEVSDRLRWGTEGDGLDYCTLPAPAALELALEVVDEKKVYGLVIDPFQETELSLRRAEIAALAQGTPIPLVGYVTEIPIEPDERVLVAELDRPPSSELIAAIERALGGDPDVAGYSLRQTFNAERDLEP